LAFSYWFDKPRFLTEGRLATVIMIPSSWGSQLGGYLPASHVMVDVLPSGLSRWLHRRSGVGDAWLPVKTKPSGHGGRWWRFDVDPLVEGIVAAALASLLRLLWGKP
jgi:hypothetical protein